MQKENSSQFGKVFWVAIMVVFVTGMVLPAFAADPTAGAKGSQQGVEENSPPAGDIQKVASCPYCGMNRHKFAHSRVFIEYDDGSFLGACSIHCAAVDMAVHIDKAPKNIWVGDFNHKELIDAEKAIWTIGGDKMGVMTKRAKWAFGEKDAAEQYIKAHGGKIASFEEIMEGTYEDMYKDTKMIREKRKNKRMMKMKQH